ncbi:MAG: HesA/MoeB/ThiF family protein [Bacteroidota bacterium]
MLSSKEIARYNRQILLPDFGTAGQKKLKQARILMIGAGGLGCAVLPYLTAAGVGTIGIVDFDTVDNSNLHRQPLYTTDDIGKQKVGCAVQRLAKQNEFVKFEAHPHELSNQNAIELFSNYDIIIDGTDNFASRYLINDACILLDKPLVYGAIHRFEGQVTVFNYGSNTEVKGPSYRCLFPEPPSANAFPDCSEAGVIGVLPGLIGLMQANETIKIITGIGDVLSGRLMMVNMLNMEFNTLHFNRNNEKNILSPASAEELKEYDYKLFCSRVNNT